MKGVSATEFRKSIHILLVDPSAQGREEVTKILQQCLYEVSTVSSCKQCLEKLKEMSTLPDIILVDVPSSGDRSTHRFISQMSRHETYSKVCYLAMSNDDSVETVMRSLKRGAVDFLVKPLRVNELQNLWTHVWRRSQGNLDCEPDNYEDGVHSEGSTEDGFGALEKEKSKQNTVSEGHREKTRQSAEGPLVHAKTADAPGECAGHVNGNGQNGASDESKNSGASGSSQLDNGSDKGSGKGNENGSGNNHAKSNGYRNGMSSNANESWTTNGRDYNGQSGYGQSNRKEEGGNNSGNNNSGNNNSGSGNDEAPTANERQTKEPAGKAKVNEVPQPSPKQATKKAKIAHPGKLEHRNSGVGSGVNPNQKQEGKTSAFNAYGSSSRQARDMSPPDSKEDPNGQGSGGSGGNATAPSLPSSGKNGTGGTSCGARESNSPEAVEVEEVKEPKLPPLRPPTERSPSAPPEHIMQQPPAHCLPPPMHMHNGFTNSMPIPPIPPMPPMLPMMAGMPGGPMDPNAHAAAFLSTQIKPPMPPVSPSAAMMMGRSPFMRPPPLPMPPIPPEAMLGGHYFPPHGDTQQLKQPKAFHAKPQPRPGPQSQQQTQSHSRSHSQSHSHSHSHSTLSERREAALHKFRAKRKERFFGKKIRYHSRKKLADARPRNRGQFISRASKGGEASDKDDDAVSNECSTIETNEKDEGDDGDDKEVSRQPTATV